MEIEKQRGISVTSSVMQFDYGGHAVNLLDTPGHQDFSEDTYRVLTAVDAAVMVIDAAKGVETQTIKLFEVCRLRDMPIITFVNKMDREVARSAGAAGRDRVGAEDPLRAGHLADRHGQELPRRVPPAARRAAAVHAGRGARRDDTELIKGLDNPRLAELFPRRTPRAAATKSTWCAARARRSTRRLPRRPPDAGVLRLRASTTSACARFCRRWSTGRRRRSRATAAPRQVDPTEAPFSGFVFKIQANMDPKHRDRIAFLRVCSGRFERGMKMQHLRIGREMKRLQRGHLHGQRAREQSKSRTPATSSASPTTASCRSATRFTEGEALASPASRISRRTFSAQCAPATRSRSSSCTRACSSSAKKARCRSSHRGRQHAAARRRRPAAVRGGRQRLQGEYKVDAIFDGSSVTTARWLTYPDKNIRRDFERQQYSSLATDVDGNPVYLAPNKYNLQVTLERWPKVGFHATREHGERLAQG